MAWIWDNIWPLVTTVIAVYGAVLATVKFLRSRKINLSFITDYQLIKQAKYLVVTVINKSAFPVTIEKIGLKTISGEDFGTLDIGRAYNTPLPKMLKQGERATFYASTMNFPALETRYGTDTQDGSHKYPVVPYARDSSNKEYKGKMLYVPESWVIALIF